MHQKKSEVQIGKETIGVSSDFNHPFSVHQKFHHNHNHIHNHFFPQIITTQHELLLSSSTPYKRTQTPFSSLSKSPTLSQLSHHSRPQPQFKTLNITAVIRSTVICLLRRLKYLRNHRHLRPTLLLSLPFFYFLVSHSTHSFLLDFLSAFAFSAVLLLSLNLTLPRLPSLRLFLARSLKPSASPRPVPRLPVFWTIGSRHKAERRAVAVAASPGSNSCSECWVQVYGNGDVYEGEFHKGKCSGSGVYYYSMSGRYEGDWVDGKYDGYGVETWARGSRFRGQYRKGLRNGFGVYRFYTADVYGGEWFNGQSHGCGIHTCEDGSRYVGEFKWGVKHGLGHYHFRNGDTYAGEYFADKMHGFGVYHFANGHRYEGAWHEGRRQGLGMYTFRNGETQSGHWENGVLDIPSTQSTTYPVSPVGVYHSKVLNAVQEARRAAEKAYDVAKVDERVNRAVAAANRAANAARVAAVKAVQKQMHHVNHESFPIPIV
ncbi:hypothetical protein TanjilG_10494 [Lupinus angustifolius]|uniref:Uncharacterized protein n=1 Tax=Lupinus angustifolius TaxID=3871 RepID=A0A4P1R4K7_LUPAN|nr:PREDICTED: uncharacterized protein LOC109361368 [Lupinus angustifolius]XP_019462397.1 PREDICTED: uncharacterized protein LOC109361368 [Lupinus angustifolius]OIW01333.1 hypothetical protein TanjilG_10494 [Lupinus angustifolius]